MVPRKESVLKCLLASAAACAFFFLAIPAVAQTDIDLEKATNGEDADTAPGPFLAVGSPVLWTYVATNTGGRDLTDVAVTDDQGVVVSCPSTTLAAGESMTCTGSGVAQAGQYSNLGTVTARQTDGSTISDSDPSHYFGQAQAPLALEKRTEGIDADLPPGPVLAVGDPVSWTYEVTNTGTDPLSKVSVTDDQGVVVTCPATTLAPGAAMTCTGSGTVQAGQYTNLGTVLAELPSGATVGASDPSHYFGQNLVLDFGDAGPSYPTSFAADGARHLLGSAVFLGACADSELDGTPTGTADGDDTGAGLSVSGSCAVAGDDEDGVTFTAPVAPGTTATVDVTASAPCTLSAWIDFNRDGDWLDAGETLFPGGTVLAAGNNPLSFAVPASAVGGATVSRFRCTTDGAVLATGLASDGEVEDHPVTLAAPGVSATKTAALAADADGDGQADPGDVLVYSVVVSNSGTAAATGVLFTDTPDANTALVNGSVTTTAGAVTTGNGAGDGTVSVAVGTLAAGGTVTITFRVTIDDPLPPGVTQVTNQGTVTGTNFSAAPTDDPGAAGPADPTVIGIDGAAVAEVPTLGGWGLLALLSLLGGFGFWKMRAIRV